MALNMSSILAVKCGIRYLSHFGGEVIAAYIAHSLHDEAQWQMRAVSTMKLSSVYRASSQ